ncbi:MAG: hypothetical protein SGILL_002830, partial [Bacillariaceae sp.]
LEAVKTAQREMLALTEDLDNDSKSSEFLLWVQREQDRLQGIVDSEGGIEAAVRECEDVLDHQILGYVTLQYDSKFKTDMKMDEILKDESVKAKIDAWWREGNMDAIHAFEEATVRGTAELVHNIVDCRLLTGLLIGDIHIIKERFNGSRTGLWMKLSSEFWRWYCIGMLRKNEKASRSDTVAIKGDFAVDLTNGDLVQIDGRLSDNSGVYLKQQSLGKHGYYVNGDMYDVANRFTAWRGYCRKSKYLNKAKGETRFCRVNCNIDQDPQDNEVAACKTDYDHWLGYLFNSIFAGWRCHHAVNQQFHHIRFHVKKWLCPQKYGERYAAEQKDRQWPSFSGAQPVSLTERKKGEFFQSRYFLDWFKEQQEQNLEIGDGMDVEVDVDGTDVDVDGMDVDVDVDGMDVDDSI